MASTGLLAVDGAHGGRLAFQQLLASDERFGTDEFNDFDDAFGAACEYIQRVLDRQLDDFGVVGNSESHPPETANYIASYLLAGLDAFVDWFGTLGTAADSVATTYSTATATTTTTTTTTLRPARFQLR